MYTTIGFSQMSRFASGLVANGTITKIENGKGYPLQFHRLSFHVLLSMFKNILTPLVDENHCVLGAQTTTDVEDRIVLDAIVNSVAFECIIAMYAVLYNKASRISRQATGRFGVIPSINSSEFPAYCTALINSIGPVEFDGIPSRGTHVPYLVWTDIQNPCPNNSAIFQVVKFKEKMARSNPLSLASVDVTVQGSSPWWTFHAYPTSESTATSPQYSLWSPVRFDACEHLLKLGVLLAQAKLTTGIGVINFSATPFYPIQNPNRKNVFPADFREYPYFVKSLPAFYEVVESYQEDKHGQSPCLTRYPNLQPQHIPSTGHTILQGTTQIGSSAGSVQQKKRQLPDGTSFLETNEAVQLHRLVYHYFDHIVVSQANPYKICELLRVCNSEYSL